MLTFESAMMFVLYNQAIRNFVCRVESSIGSLPDADIRVGYDVRSLHQAIRNFVCRVESSIGSLPLPVLYPR
jgi:hypothetical protein